MKLTIIRGLQASGKSSLARSIVADTLANDKPAWIVERDALRAMAGLGTKPGPYESVITQQQHGLIRLGLKQGNHVVSSDTNLAAKYVKALAEIADHFGAEIEVIDVDTPLEICILRDAIRGEAGGHEVGSDVIRSTHKRYFTQGKFPANPLINRPAPVRLEPYQPNTALSPTYIFDIDGTVSKMAGRSPYDYTKVLTDLPHEDVLELAWLLYAAGNKIVFLSGRDGSCVNDTEIWIEKNSNFRIGTNCFLFMRPPGDSRADYIVKYELFTTYIAPYFYVKGTFDDRDQVVDLWRSIGLRCYQVNYGNF